jgi:hypothetical protein
VNGWVNAADVVGWTFDADAYCGTHAPAGAQPVFAGGDEGTWAEQQACDVCGCELGTPSAGRTGPGPAAGAWPSVRTHTLGGAR